MNKKCCGCGVELQNKRNNSIGYTDNLNNDLCERCFKLKHYGEYKKVELTNEDYKKILDNIPKDALVVYITSLINIDLDYINNLKKYILVLTKRDLLPKSVKDYKLINYINNHITNSYLDIEIISAIKNHNVDSLMDKIKKYGANKEIYFIGMTNSGKSTLINSLIKNYTDSSLEITTSFYPSTTLDKNIIKINDLLCIDTPGLTKKNNILNNMNIRKMKKIIPRKEIKPRSYQIKKATSLLIDNIIRIDINVPDNITFFLSNDLKITRLSQDNQKARDKNKYIINIEKKHDLVIEDVCFIKFQKGANVIIYSPFEVNIHTRDNLI